MPFFQGASDTLTLTRVATAPVLVAEVAKAAKLNLEVAPPLRTEVLMVSVENAKPSEVLARLAIAASATWEKTEGGYRLVADKGARAAEASRERALRLERIQADVKKRAAEAKDPKGAAMVGALMGNASVDDFLPMLDPNVLAGLETGDRVVFADHPTAMQRPLRGDASPIVANWIAAHNKSAREMSSSAAEMPESMDALMKGPLGERFRRMSKPVLGTPTKIVVVASRGAMPFLSANSLNIRLEVRAYDARGAVLVEETGSIAGGMAEFISEMGGAKPATPAAKATPIVYSEAAKALAAPSAPGMMSGFNLSGAGKAPSVLRAVFLDPLAREPLGLVPGEGLVALAKARRKPLVACLPDSAYPTMLGNRAPKTVEEVEEGLKTGALRAIPDLEYLVVKPAMPETSRRDRLDRTALATLARASSDHESPTLDELAEFATRSPEPSRNPIVMSALGLFAPSALGSMSGMVSWDALRLFASLTPAQRETLAAGKPVGFATLSNAAQDALRPMLYGATGGVSVDREGVSNEPDPVSVGLKMALGGGGLDARDEPTEAAPNGLPANGYLQATVTSEPIIRPLDAEGPSASTLDADTLAVVRLVRSSGLDERTESLLKMPEAGRLGTRTAWSLRGYVAPGAYVAATLRDDRTPKDGEKVSLAALPDDFQARVAKRAESLKNSPLGAILSMAGAKKGGPPREP